MKPKPQIWEGRLSENKKESKVWVKQCPQSFAKAVASGVKQKETREFAGTQAVFLLIPLFSVNR